MEFTPWISPALSAVHPFVNGRTTTTLGPLLTSSWPGRLAVEADAPLLPLVTHTPGIAILFGSKIQPTPLSSWRPSSLVGSFVFSIRTLLCTPQVLAQLHQSQSHSPTSGCHTPLPVMGTQVAGSWSCSRSQLGSCSSACSGSPSPPWPQCLLMPARWLPRLGSYTHPNAVHLHPFSTDPLPHPLFSFQGFRMEEETFVKALSAELGTLGDLYSVAASLGFPHSQVDQFMTSFPHNFPEVMYTTLAIWYMECAATFHTKLDMLEKAFTETHKGALLTCLCCHHSYVLQAVCSIPQVQLPDKDVMDESLGEAVMSAIDMISSNHLHLVRTVLCEVLTTKDLLTIAEACRMNPMLAIVVTETLLHPLAKATCIFLPWFADDAIPLKDKYLCLKFGFQCTNLLLGFTTILDDIQPEIIDISLPTLDKHLFQLSFTPSICVSAAEARQSLMEWELTFLTILCTAVFHAHKIQAVIPSLCVSVTILNDAMQVHGLAS